MLTEQEKLSQEDVEFVEAEEVKESKEAPPKKDWTVVWIVLGILYVLSPIDIIPEAILGPLGFADDAAMLAFLMKKLYDKLKK